METTQIAHIAAETIIVAGVIYYVHTKTSGYEVKIKDLEEKLNEQNERLQQLENIIYQGMRARQAKNIPQRKVVTENYKPPPVKHEVPVVKHAVPAVKHAAPVVNEDSSSEDDEDLDEELGDELAELENDADDEEEEESKEENKEEDDGILKNDTIQYLSEDAQKRYSEINSETPEELEDLTQDELRKIVTKKKK